MQHTSYIGNKGQIKKNVLKMKEKIIRLIWKWK